MHPQQYIKSKHYHFIFQKQSRWQQEEKTKQKTSCLFIIYYIALISPGNINHRRPLGDEVSQELTSCYNN